MDCLKKLTLFTFTLFFFYCGEAAYSQPADSDENFRLTMIINDVITGKCHLTELSSRKAVVISNDNMEVKINFDNSSLRSFWSPEVAVQYIFDAALQPLLYAVFKEHHDRYKNVKCMTFIVDISPHDIPPALVFRIYQSDFINYKKNALTKESFYRKIGITAGGEKFKFDAGYAAGIE